MKVQFGPDAGIHAVGVTKLERGEVYMLVNHGEIDRDSSPIIGVHHADLMVAGYKVFGISVDGDCIWHENDTDCLFVKVSATLQVQA